ncbi:RidA family protein [Candidatus Gottesmanbacteria bacterium]|nr:RidA family protein [Candidatus Gottesmanbacteria bacterium]
MKEEVKTKKAPEAIGPYSQAVKFGNLVFCAGQIGLDPKTNNLVEGIKKQTKQAFANIKNVLESVASSLEKVLKMNVYLKNMDDFAVMNEIYATYYKKPYPARATVEVARLPKGALIEIECVAYIQKEDEENCCGGGCGGDCR